jgi:hypothetical protein
MGTLLNAHPVRQHPTSAPKISKHFACYYAPRSKKGSKQPTGSKKLVSKMLTKCLLIEQGEYNEHAGRILLAVYQVSGGQVPTLVHALTSHLSWLATWPLLKINGTGDCSMPVRAGGPNTSRILEIGCLPIITLKHESQLTADVLYSTFSCYDYFVCSRNEKV